MSTAQILFTVLLAQLLSNTPEPVAAVIWARSFTLDTPTPHAWCAERPLFTSGTVLVLEADPAQLRPSDTRASLLFAGPLPVERASAGFASGRVLVILPSTVDPRQVPFYFDGVELAERVDAQVGARALEGALEAGIRPFDAKIWDRAFAEGGGPLHVRDADALYRSLAAVVERYVPEDEATSRLYRRIGAP